MKTIRIPSNTELLQRIADLPDGSTEDLNHWDVRELTDFSYAFANKDFQGDISEWNMCKAKTLRAMFMASTFNGDIKKWDVSNVNDMRFMFEHSNFNSALETWNVEKLVDASYMFRCSKFNQSLQEWKPRSIANMRSMFEFSNATNIDIRSWMPLLRKNRTDLRDAFRCLRNETIYEMMAVYGKRLVENNMPVDDDEDRHLKNPLTPSATPMLNWCLRLEFPEKETLVSPLDQLKWDLIASHYKEDPTQWFAIAKNMITDEPIQWTDIPEDVSLR
jgi:hypothetical protein